MVDFIGMDCYHGRNTAAFESNVQAMVEVRGLRHKPVGITETGLENDHKADYWTQMCCACARRTMRDGRGMAQRQSRHAYGPYPSDASAEDFKLFDADEWTLLERDLPDMYSMPKNVTVK